MKIEKLKFLEAIITSEFASEISSHSVYYKDGEHWINLLDNSFATNEIAYHLDLSIVEPISHFVRSTSTAWLFIKECNATFALSFTKSLRSTTRIKHREKIKNLQERADNAYRVSHHPLTHLLAKDAFRDIMSHEISAIKNQSPPSIDAQESEQPVTLAVLALDIDHFKQINDTWGHLYGDQVLKIFGKRLEDAARKITDGSEANPTIYLGHPSGEEFLILISAKMTKEQLSIWANDFRLSISEEVLPTEKEWTWLAKTENLAILSLPPTKERSVSTSIGVTLHTSLAKTTDLTKNENNSSTLLDLADTALYRAKAAGRNQVIFYDEILSSCGRVLEHDESTGIIAIDIGTNVGVTLGQEFKVFHPTYTGKEKFLINDGRTTRTLGIYPRVECARIIVFNSQPEVSFAYIDDNKDFPISLPVSSTLEAIPAGSIGHLLPSSSKFFPAATRSLPTSGFQTLQTLIRTEATNNQEPYAIVVRFNREPEYTKKFGTAALNVALARLYKSAQITFHSSRAVEVLDKSSICIIGNKKTYSEKIVTEFTDKMANELPELGVLTGVFNNKDLAELKEQKIHQVVPESFIEFARFSASGAGFDSSTRIRHFNTSTAYTILLSLREARSHDIAYADFEKLLDLGIDTGLILNIGALTAGSLGYSLRAQELFKLAMLKEPTNLIFKTNYGTESHILGDFETPLEILNKLNTADLEKIKTTHSFGYFTYAALLAEAKLANSHYYNDKRFKAMAPAAIAMNFKSTKSLKSIEIIKSALNS